MATGDLLQTLVDSDFGYKHEGSTWGRAVKHSSLVVDEKLQRWYWNSEDKGGDVIQYLIQIRGMDRKKATEFVDTRSRAVGYVEMERSNPYSPYEKLVKTLWEFGKDNRKYWYSRKLTDTTIDMYQLGYFNGWNTIPLYENGVFVNFQCRRDEPTRGFRYWYDGDKVKPVLINSDILQLVDTIYITEGAVDTLLMNQEGFPSVAQTGGAGYWSNEWFGLFSRVKNIFYIADNDKAGRFASSRIAENLGSSRVRIFNYTGEAEKFDTVDYFRSGGTKELLRKRIHDESKYVFELGDIDGYSSRKEKRSKGKAKKAIAGFDRRY